MLALHSQSLWSPRHSGPEWTLGKKYQRQEKESVAPWLSTERMITFSWPPLLLPQALAVVLNADALNAGEVVCGW